MSVLKHREDPQPKYYLSSYKTPQELRVRADQMHLHLSVKTYPCAWLFSPVRQVRWFLKQVP